MDTTADNKLQPRTISGKVADGIERALTAYYLGAPLTKAFAGDDTISREYYYSLKKSNPEEIDVIDAKAKALAAEQRDSTLVRIDSAQVEGSSRAQLAAIDAVNDHLIARLVDIVSLAGWEVNYRGEVIDVSIFPRDIAECGRLLRDIAKEGLISEAARIDRLTEKISSGGAIQATQIQFLGAKTDWDHLTVVKADGTEVTVSIDEDVIDAEVKES